MNESILRDVVLDIIRERERATIEDIACSLPSLPRARISGTILNLESDGAIRCTGRHKGRQVREVCA